MSRCISCGSMIPEGTSCSMCFGDMDHGSDEFYRNSELEKQRQRDENYHNNQQDWGDDER